MNIDIEVSGQPYILVHGGAIAAYHNYMYRYDTGSFENLLYVQEDVSDTKEQLETKLDNPDEIILDRICDEVFGDG